MSKTTGELWAIEDCDDLLLACERCGEVFYSWEVRRACPDCDWEQVDAEAQVSLPGKTDFVQMAWPLQTEEMS